MLPSNQEHNTIYRYRSLGHCEVSPLSPQRLWETWRAFGCDFFPAQAGAVPWNGTVALPGAPCPVWKGPLDCVAVSHFCGAAAPLPPVPCWWAGGDSWVLLGTTRASPTWPCQGLVTLTRGRCQQLSSDLPGELSSGCAHAAAAGLAHITRGLTH